MAVADVPLFRAPVGVQSGSATCRVTFQTSPGVVPNPATSITGASDQKIIFWDLQRNQPRGILTSGELQIQQIQLVDEDRVFAAADGRQVRIWYKNDGLTEEAR